MNISVDWKTLLCVITVAAMILISVIIISKEVRYYTKRKFDSIEEYNRLQAKELKTYKESQEQYRQNMKDSGIENKHDKIIFPISTKTGKKIRGSE